MITLEKIADLDRRGMRDAAIMAAMAAEAAGMRASRMELWPFGKRNREREERRRDISRSLSMLLSVPPLAQFEMAYAERHEQLRTAYAAYGDISH